MSILIERHIVSLSVSVFILPSLLATLRAEDVPDFLAQVYKKEIGQPSKEQVMGRDEAKGYQKDGNMGRLKPMCRARDDTAMGQQRDGPMGEAVGSQRAQEGRAKKDWIMGLTLAQLLEDSVENKYMELYQRHTYAPRHLRKAHSEDPKRRRRQLGVRHKRMDNGPVETKADMGRARSHRKRRDVPNDDIHDIDNFMNEGNDQREGKNDGTVDDKDEKDATKEGLVEGIVKNAERPRSERPDEMVEPDHAETDVDGLHQMVRQSNQDVDGLHQIVRQNNQGQSDAPTPTINYLDLVTFKQAPSLGQLLRKKVYRRVQRSTSADPGHPTHSEPEMSTQDRSLQNENKEEFVVPPKIADDAATTQKSYPYNAAKVYHEFNDIMGWIQTKTKVRQQVENPGETEANKERANTKQDNVNKGQTNEPLDEEERDEDRPNETTRDYIDIVNERIEANRAAAQKWAETKIIEQIEEERAAKKEKEKNMEENNEAAVQEKEEPYTHRPRPEASDLSGDYEEDENGDNGLQHFYPREDITESPEKTAEPESKVNINSIKYQYMQLRKKYNQMSGESKKENKVKERIELLKESYKHKYHELSRKTLDKVEDYGPDRTEELAAFPREWYEKNKDKVRTLKEIEEEDRKDDEDRARRAAGYSTKEPTLRTIWQSIHNRHVEIPKEVGQPKTRRKRATKVLIRKNNATFVVSYKHLNLFRRKNVRIYLNHEHIRKFDSRKKRHVMNIMMMGKRKRETASQNQFENEINVNDENGNDSDSEPQGISEDDNDGKDDNSQDVNDNEISVNGNTQDRDQPIYLDDSDIIIRNADSTPENDENLLEVKADDIIDSNYGDPNDILIEKEVDAINTKDNLYRDSAEATKSDSKDKNMRKNTLETHTDNLNEQDVDDAVVTKNIESVRQNKVVDTQSTVADAQSTVVDTQSTVVDTQSTIANARSTVVDAQSTVADAQSTVVDAQSTVVDALKTVEHINKIDQEAKDTVVMADENPLPILVRRKRGDADFIYVTKPKRGWKNHIKKKIRELKERLSTKFRDRIYEWTTKHKWETLPDEKDRTTPTLMTKKFLNYKKLHRMGYGR